MPITLNPRSIINAGSYRHYDYKRRAYYLLSKMLNNNKNYSMNLTLTVKYAKYTHNIRTGKTSRTYSKQCKT